MRGSGTTRPPDKTGFSLWQRRKVAEFTPPLSPACVQVDRWVWADGYSESPFLVLRCAIRVRELVLLRRRRTPQRFVHALPAFRVGLAFGQGHLFSSNEFLEVAIALHHFRGLFPALVARKLPQHSLVCLLSLALWRSLEMWMLGEGLGVTRAS